MERSKQKELKRQYAVRIAKVSRLLRRYAPILPADPYSDKDDYENYYGEFVVKLSNHATQEDLFARLREIRTTHFQAPENDALDSKIASQLMKVLDTEPTPDDLKPIETPVLFELDPLTPELLNIIRERALSQASSLQPVSRVVIGYEIEQGGWLMVHFDRRPGAESDGEWTKHIQTDKIQMESWESIKIMVFGNRGPIQVQDIHGTRHTITTGEELANLFGEWIVWAIRSEGLREHFDANWAITVEDFNGHFGWSSEVRL